MTERATFDRILRDDGDASGQTIRQWSIQAEPGRVTIRNAPDGSYLLGMRADDVEAFMADLKRARAFAFEAKETTARDESGSAQ